ncbi:hypothetical protein GCM10018790_44950 [Kitasatospora xanthocidica]|uniref:DUF397 domain-containing protein n=1 Tax=Kitasatospora xanthocidica TaxID=83382 RepID=UPI0019A29DBD|nr:DUF397 domain-containing protein [Kitasatospora xanthocidica]GHF61972.1 hypothetical protein GCM10018790_44950 [Kitasatospora xanthocidica]
MRDPVEWRKPNACGDGNNCPEVAITSDAVYVRSSLLPDAVAQLTPTEWRDLVSAIRAGEFDA